jgi:pyruvate dehydrogenase E2 component (dihydrolipoamide acetyltransferase)
MTIAAATPAARRLANEKNIDLASIDGTGRLFGREDFRYVQVSDIESADPGVLQSMTRAMVDVKSTYLARSVAAYLSVDLSRVPVKAGGDRVTKSDVIAFHDRLGSDVVLPLDNMRDVIAKRMTESMRTSPQYTMMMEVDCLALKRYKKEVSETIVARTGIKPTYSDLFIKACAISLAKNPMLNAYFMGDHILLKSSVHVGIAVSLGEKGLIVPNIKDTQTLSLADIAVKRDDLVTRARAGGLAPDEYVGGTFTISNLGVSPVQFFTPIINLPESAILGVGNMTDKVVPIDGGFGVRPMCGVSLTCDHRVVDGATGEQFMKDLKEALENPTILD